MAQDLGSNSCLCQLREGITSPHRPPHLNETVCGCRCGCGCQVLSEEYTNIASDGETLVDDSPTSERSLSPLDSQYTDSESISPRPSPHPLETIPLREFLFGNNILLSGAGGGQGEEGGAAPLALGSPRELSESLYNEPYEAGDHSSAVSERGSVRVVSPGPAMEGGRVERRYYFLVVPLRLSPQYEHCRGKVASHLVEEE